MIAPVVPRPIHPLLPTAYEQVEFDPGEVAERGKSWPYIGQLFTTLTLPDEVKKKLVQKKHYRWAKQEPCCHLHK